MKTGTMVVLTLATAVLIATTFAYASYAQTQAYPYPSTPSQGGYNGRCSVYPGYYGGGMMGYMMGGYRGGMMSGYYGAPMMGGCGGYGGWYP